MKQNQPASVVAETSNKETVATGTTMTAAYRDGLYVGKLAAQRGEQRQAPVGRWATQADRDAFQAGYYQTNAQVAETIDENQIDKK